MELIAFLLRSARGKVLGVVLASIVNGVLSAATIAIVHRALSPDSIGVGMLAAAFVGVVLAKAASQFVAQMLLVQFAQDVVLRMCRELCDRVLAAPLERLERLGSARLLATLNDDVVVVSAAVHAVPTLTTNSAVLVGCSAYLLWLSWPVFLLCVLMVLIGVAGYRLLLGRAHVALQTAREGRDRLFGAFRALIEGIKELKLHRARRDDFVRHDLEETTALLRDQGVVAIRQYMIADVWCQLLFFGLVGMLLFGAPVLAAMSTETLTGYVFATLYMMTPVWTLVGSVPVFMRGKVSLAKIAELGSGLEEGASDAQVLASTPPQGPLRIETDALSYVYPATVDGDIGFALGPLDLTLASGEVVFVTGGNGSGKSTLVRLLSGLYLPTSGQLRLNGNLIDASNRAHYREHFTVVFADFHLFERLHGLESHQRSDQVASYLALLGIERKVQVRDGKFSTTALSSGQRRRLALLVAYLEDRPVYVFDEWAADQDPAYKETFYLRLLPELKARGKCVIVITHDDRYFSLGDRVLKLDAGKIVEERHRGPHREHETVAPLRAAST